MAARVSDASAGPCSLCSMVWPGSGAGGGKGISNLLQTVSIKENPSKLNDFGGILGNVDTVFIAGSRNMDHDVAVDVELRLLRRHDGDGSAGSSQQTYARRRAATIDGEAIAGPLAMGRREGE